MAAHPSELRLTHEVIGSPRRAGSFNLKSFEGPGEPEASLDELGNHEVQQQAENSNRLRQRKRHINCDCEGGHSCLLKDYFSENFKCTAEIHILAYESPANSVDEYVRLVNCTTIECLEAFVKGVNEIFGDEYLRSPNNNDINHLLQIGEARRFPGMLGSIDCMHWEWKNYPVSCGILVDFATYLYTRHYMHTKGMYQQLQADLMKHIWARLDHNNYKI
ncbi:hypothetical protein JHK82_031842 [Glycine max]|uniref:Uncharacterized protein n=1 Tax=Glycine max TaxID=3847 RepID=K7LR74_SOYBN|nr:hypothetical protein JHK85_032500 [Glycine max]KAG4995108.1 hypothetical protein JHK86_031935 [Glycine max]KAG5125105.1 hypothetical protein JHK82_031842 [Glycine max]KAG5146532.1 hypothetical protein JHK84_032075 [Glycine max]